MNVLRVTNIQRGCVYDGPGVRTTVFLKGCSLKCPWCCNPENISYEEQWFVENERCVLFQDKKSVLCSICERVGGSRSIKECPFGVSQSTSKDFGCDELLAVLIKDKSLYDKTNGGVTFSGGEPILQSVALLPLLKQLKRFGIHVAFETTLCVPENKQQELLPYIDCLIVDLKLQPQMMLDDVKYLENLKRYLSNIKEKEVYYRLVFVNEMYNRIDDIIEILKQLNISFIEVLICHGLGEKKYTKLNMKFSRFYGKRIYADGFCDNLNSKGINTKILSI